VIDAPWRISSPGRCVIGSQVYIGPQCYIVADGGMTIEDGAMIGPHFYAQTSGHVFDGPDLQAVPYDHRLQGRPIHVGAHAWIGGRVTLVPGVRVGRGAVVGSGAVISKDVPDYAVVVGGPQRVIRMRDAEVFERLVASGKGHLAHMSSVGFRHDWVPR
jgi:maltose O-acetyltransferase